jgi:hypothetical protein
MGRRALPAICSEMSLELASRPALQGFGTWAQEADQRGQLPKMQEEAGQERPLGLGLQGHLLALGCGSVRGAGGRDEREGRLHSGGARMPASQDGPAAGWADGRLQVSAQQPSLRQSMLGALSSPGSP